MLPLAFEITPAGQPHLIQNPLEVGHIAREAEDAGFSAVLSPEGGNDGLLSCFAMAQATKRIHIGTAIAIIYNRQPTLCAAAAVMVQEASAGRLVLGIGVGHRPVLESMGITPAANSRRGAARLHAGAETNLCRPVQIGPHSKAQPSHSDSSRRADIGNGAPGG